MCMCVAFASSITRCVHSHGYRCVARDRIIGSPQHSGQIATPRAVELPHATTARKACRSRLRGFRKAGRKPLSHRSGVAEYILLQSHRHLGGSRLQRDRRLLVQCAHLSRCHACRTRLASTHRLAPALFAQSAGLITRLEPTLPYRRRCAL
eukprot:6426643-Prymnesium_polylepis.1